MKRKAWVALLVVIALMVTMVAGCGGGKAAPEKKAETWPTKSMTLIVPYAPGGSSDLSARPIAEEMNKLLGQPMVVVNKAGAGGSVGSAEVAAAKGDGYTFLNASIGGITIVPYTQNVGYNYESFKAVAQMTDIPLAIAVKKDSPFKTLKDFIDYAKANPDKIKIGNPGAGNIQHVACEYFSKQAGIKVTNVPFEGANPAVTALLGGHIDATFTGVTEVTSQYKAGDFRILAVTATEPCPLMPDVPTFKSQGYDVVFGVWYGILAPKSTPDEIVNKTAEAVKTALADPKVKETVEKLNLIAAYLGPQDFAARIAADAKTNEQVLKDIGLAKK